ncbi:hypothetical protein X738_27820 [Mesorhizobium sp. LNHC209A00]|nr:hypothetical protein X738_27820 [Mesorhizobium sp. LNHC209A00]
MQTLRTWTGSVADMIETDENAAIREWGRARAGDDENRLGRCGRGDPCDVRTGSRPGRRHSESTSKYPLPKFRPFQLCTLTDDIPVGTTWLFEMKFDGYRAGRTTLNWRVQSWPPLREL